MIHMSLRTAGQHSVPFPEPFSCRTPILQNIICCFLSVSSTYHFSLRHELSLKHRFISSRVSLMNSLPSPFTASRPSPPFRRSTSAACHAPLRLHPSLTYPFTNPAVEWAKYNHFRKILEFYCSIAACSHPSVIHNPSFIGLREHIKKAPCRFRSLMLLAHERHATILI